MRWTSNMLSLWALCGKPACRRAQSCRRNPHICVDRYARLVPKDAGYALTVMADGLAEGLSFDAVSAQAPDAFLSFERWVALVESAAYGDPRPPERDDAP
jgi:hypothetical protein